MINLRLKNFFLKSSFLNLNKFNVKFNTKINLVFFNTLLKKKSTKLLKILLKLFFLLKKNCKYNYKVKYLFLKNISLLKGKILSRNFYKAKGVNAIQKKYLSKLYVNLNFFVSNKKFNNF